MNIDINKNAPVIGNNEIIINAPMEKVIKTLSDINNWVNWRKTVTKSELLDPLAENANFKWTADGLNYKSKIHTYKNNAFGWTGKTIGAYAVHNWHFTENNGITTVKIEESLEGFFIKLIKKSMQNKLNNIIINDLKDLKEECEKE
ncbi:SRPBCC family protein [Dysgonomonas reticulitermitis]